MTIEQLHDLVQRLHGELTVSWPWPLPSGPAWMVEVCLPGGPDRAWYGATAAEAIAAACFELSTEVDP